MPIVGKVCTQGVFDESIPDIRFDENGKSNYALLFEKLVEVYPRGEKGLEEWTALVDKMKIAGKSKTYDCIIGVSGGTDSCYLLHLAKQWGLRPLALNLDNGWNSDISVKNIKKMTTALQIDLETYVVDYSEIKDLIKSYMRAGLSWIDMPTDLAIKAVMYKIADRENIKYILRGNDFRSEGSQPKEWTFGDGKQLLAIHKLFGRIKLKTFPNYTMINLIYYAMFKGIKSIYPFYYLEYNKNKAQQFLMENYDWEYYGGHHFENTFTKFTMSYWLYEKFGIDKRKITLSAQVLSGEITRQQALAELEKLPYDVNQKDEMIAYVCKKLDLTRMEFDELFNAPNKSYRDYPSYDKLFKKLNSSYSWIISKIFLHKPQSYYKQEIIGS